MTPYSEHRDAIDALVTRYVCGEISELVFVASALRYLDRDEVRHLVLLNQVAHRNSMSFRRGEVR
jgi:hypothetical protein